MKIDRDVDDMLSVVIIEEYHIYHGHTNGYPAISVNVNAIRRRNY
jgi:hypothetical protein